MRKVGIFGGTFNPIHWGHLLAAETALAQISLDRVFWIPTSHALYKPTAESVSFRDRYQMVQLAIDSHPQFELPEFLLPDEADSASGYAIDTLKALQQYYGICEWCWILGLDAFASLPRWVGRQELIPQCLWLVVPRWTVHLDQEHSYASHNAVQNAMQNDAAKPATSLLHSCFHVANQLRSEGIGVRWQLLQMPLVQISSSLVRQYCQQGRSIRYLVPEAVREYISVHQLYRNLPE